MRRGTMAGWAVTSLPVATLTVDQREQVSPVPGLLARSPSVALVVSPLRSGDYALGDALGIERKTGPDLARSIVDGRLFQQVGALRLQYRRPVLLVEGLLDGAEVLGVSWPALQGALLSVSVCFGVPVLRAADAGESAELILTAVRQLGEPIPAPYVRPGFRPRGWRRRALFILQGLPGVGPRRASALLRRFGSVAAIAGANGATLSAVPGVGRAVIQKIREALGPEPTASEPTRPSAPKPGPPRDRGWASRPPGSA